MQERTCSGAEDTVRQSGSRHSDLHTSKNLQADQLCQQRRRKVSVWGGTHLTEVARRFEEMAAYLAGHHESQDPAATYQFDMVHEQDIECWAKARGKTKTKRPTLPVGL